MFHSDSWKHILKWVQTWDVINLTETRDKRLIRAFGGVPFDFDMAYLSCFASPVKMKLSYKDMERDGEIGQWYYITGDYDQLLFSVKKQKFPESLTDLAIMSPTQMRIRLSHLSLKKLEYFGSRCRSKLPETLTKLDISEVSGGILKKFPVGLKCLKIGAIDFKVSSNSSTYCIDLTRYIYLKKFVTLNTSHAEYKFPDSITSIRCWTTLSQQVPNWRKARVYNIICRVPPRFSSRTYVTIPPYVENVSIVASSRHFFYNKALKMVQFNEEFFQHHRYDIVDILKVCETVTYVGERPINIFGDILNVKSLTIKDFNRAVYNRLTLDLTIFTQLESLEVYCHRTSQQYGSKWVLPATLTTLHCDTTRLAQGLFQIPQGISEFRGYCHIQEVHKIMSTLREIDNYCIYTTWNHALDQYEHYYEGEGRFTIVTDKRKFEVIKN